MRTSTTATLVACVALTCVTIQQLDSKPQDAKTARAADFGFGLQAAGTYLGQYTVPTPEGLHHLDVLNTFNADGTFVVSPGDMFGDGDPDFVGFRSPFHGSWSRSGPRKIQWKGIVFAFDGLGNLGSPQYAGGAYFRISGETRWDKEYQNMEGESLFEVLMEGQDPLNDEAAFSIPMTFAMRRINAQ